MIITWKSHCLDVYCRSKKCTRLLLYYTPNECTKQLKWDKPCKTEEKWQLGGTPHSVAGQASRGLELSLNFCDSSCQFGSTETHWSLYLQVVIFQIIFFYHIEGQIPYYPCLEGTFSRCDVKSSKSSSLDRLHFVSLFVYFLSHVLDASMVRLNDPERRRCKAFEICLHIKITDIIPKT